MNDAHRATQPMVELPFTESWQVTSSVRQRPYTIHVARPAYAVPQQCATVYLHGDLGGGLFRLATSLTRLLRLDRYLPALQVVSAFPVLSEREAARVRSYDALVAIEESRTLHRELVQDVIPFVERHYASDPCRRVLVGHSFSGLQVLWALADGANEFCGYLASSPALWRLGDQLEALEARIATRDPLPEIMLFLSAGELEQPKDASIGRSLHERGALFRNLERLEWLSTAITRRALPTLTLHTRIFAGETHTTVCSPAIARGLNLMLDPGRAYATSEWPELPDDVRQLIEREPIPKWSTR